MNLLNPQPYLSRDFPVISVWGRIVGMWQKRLFLAAAFGLILALWPPTFSVARLTGEEQLLSQVRGGWQWGYSALRPQPHLAPTAITTTPPAPPFGVNTFLEQEALPEVRQRAMQMIQEAGFHWLRQEFPWYDIEIHGKGDFSDRRHLDVVGEISAWDKYDNIVSLAEQYNLEIIARLSAPPAWSRAQPPEVSGPFGPPDEVNDYGDYVAAVVGRYRGRVTYFQLWNEPNIYPEWGEQNVDPAAYTNLLCTGYHRAKAANPQAIILAGAMAPTIAIDGRNLNDLIFLQRMYDAGAGECFDILTAQGYGLFSGAWDQRLRPVVINYPHNLLLRDVMVRNGDAAKPIWISEMGWNAVPDGLPQVFGQVTEQVQAQYAVEAYQRAQQEWPWVGVINSWFFKRATDGERGEPMYYFRLVEPDFTPLPVYEALREYLPDAAASPPTPRSNFYYTWIRLRPLLGLGSGALLFFLALQLWSPDARS